MKYVKSCLFIMMLAGIGYACHEGGLGDQNGDGNWNVLDIVALANCILSENCYEIEFGPCGDLNGDGEINVLDIVILANCVLAFNCGG